MLRFPPVAVLALSAVAAVLAGPEDPATPAREYKALLKEYESASSAGRKLSDDERIEFVGHVYRHREELALKFVELAETHPQDPVAVDALIQAVRQVNGTPWPVELVGRETACARALELLGRDHIGSDKLAQACERISFGFRSEYETFLRTVLEESPHEAVRGQACLALARYLKNRLQRVDLVRKQPKLAREFADLFGKDYLNELLGRDRAAAQRETEALLERATKEYGDVRLSDGGTVGEDAGAELFEMRHLIVGRPAPDIEGDDQNGKPFRLSDYRGKVILLDFWSEA